MSDLQDRLSGLSPVKRALLQRLRMAGARAPEAVPRRTESAAPLSWEQRRLWFMHRLAPEGAAYTIPVALRLTGALDAAALRAAMARLVERHQALRLAFREVDGEPVQEPGAADRIGFELVDVRAEEVDARLAEFFGRGFDLTREPPFRAALMRMGGGEHVLALALHHAASDGASTPVLLRELSALYTARVEGRDADLPDPPLQLPDYAAWQRGRGIDAASVEWWRRTLAGAPHVLEVPPDHPRPAAQAFGGSRAAFALAADASARVRALAAGEQASVFSVLLAALAVVLHRATGEEDLLIGTAVANRGVPGAEAAVGFFAGTVPLRMHVDGETTVREMVARARRAAAEAQDHAGVPFDRIVEAAEVHRDPARPPLVQVMISLDPAEEDALAIPGLHATRLPVDTAASPFDLTFSLVDGRGGIRGEILYRTDLYEPATVARLADRLTAALRAFADDPRARIIDLPLVPPDERRTLAAWARGAEARADGCVHRLFEAQARETPDALAVAWADQEVSYAELNRRANRIAHHLVAQGISAEGRVGVLMGRTPGLVAALLGVWKAGAAYVPLDPRNPPARLAAMVRASGATAVLVDRAHGGRLADAGVREIAIESIPAAPGTAHDPAAAVHPHNLAYVLFTSGSTGVPKGVEVAHGSVHALLHEARALLGPAERAAMLGSCTVGFDPSVLEIFGPLSWGGAVTLVDDPLSDPPPARPVRTAFLVPSVAAERLAADTLPPGLRTLILGGEALSPALARALHAWTPALRIINIYGPTEATIYATFDEVRRGAERVGIGKAVAGGRAYVLDGRMRPCGIGEPGELWLAGSVLARGYAGRPGLTADRFRPDPLGPAGLRMYRTGDRARVTADGTLEYRGRADAQLKVRGVRIEPGEVEAVLRAHPQVRDAAVGAHGSGERASLAAWLVAEDADHPPASIELRAWLRERLPEAMVPAAFVVMDALPRTASGKLDRRALPAPRPADPDDASAHVEPRTELEETIAAAWREVLGVPRVGVHDDFFGLGGNSLVALRLLARIRQATGAEVPVAALLQGPTVERMARTVADRRSGVRLPVVALQPEGTARPLFLVHAGGGHVACYAPLAALMAPDQPLYAFQAQGLDDGLPPLQGTEAMAAHYLRGLRRAQPRGPYRLGGWSYGGIAAFEMARQLLAAGEEVELLVLLDTGRPESRGDGRMALDHAAVLRRILTDLYGWGPTGSVTIEALRPLTPEQQLQLTARRLGPRLLPEERIAEVAALTRVRMANHNALVDYVPQPYAGRMTYLQTRGSAGLGNAQETLRFWGRLAEGGFGVHEVAGNHGTMLQPPHVQSVAEALRRVLEVSG
ncbi:MAG TPA: amino acid adenylation domain-containing protein [Longimicrobium sp.]|jgi:amino acid adenylation domain-containing protein|uniref:non-ribosomal peptide synthetase n=1 Tax=Longimicrobium sp. TaxID=2029185 RepID=UPI002ED9CF97